MIVLLATKTSDIKEMGQFEPVIGWVRFLIPISSVKERLSCDKTRNQLSLATFKRKKKRQTMAEWMLQRQNCSHFKGTRKISMKAFQGECFYFLLCSKYWRIRNAAYHGWPTYGWSPFFKYSYSAFYQIDIWDNFKCRDLWKAPPGVSGYCCLVSIPPKKDEPWPRLIITVMYM